MENFDNKEKIVKGIEFTSEDGLVLWREIYDGGAGGVWETTSIETNDTNRFKQLRNDLKDKYGDDIEM